MIVKIELADVRAILLAMSDGDLDTAYRLMYAATIDQIMDKSLREERKKLRDELYQLNKKQLGNTFRAEQLRQEIRRLGRLIG